MWFTVASKYLGWFTILSGDLRLFTVMSQDFGLLTLNYLHACMHADANHPWMHDGLMCLYHLSRDLTGQQCCDNLGKAKQYWPAWWETAVNLNEPG